MPVRKITISMDADLLHEVERFAEKAQLSRNEWLAIAARHSIHRKRLREAIDLALEESGGPVTAEERMQASRDLGLNDADAAE